MKRCVKCGHEATKEGRFCEKCGEELNVIGASSGSRLKGSLADSSRPSSARASEPSSSPPSQSSPPVKGSLFSTPSGDPIKSGSQASDLPPMSPPPMDSRPMTPSPVSPPSMNSRPTTPLPVSPSPMNSRPTTPPPVSPPPMNSRPTAPPPTSPPPMSPPLTGSPPGYTGEIGPKSPLPKVLLGIAGVAVVVLITVGVMRFLPDDANSEPGSNTVCDVVCEECEEEPCTCDEVLVCEGCEEYPCICDEVLVCEECEEYPCVCLTILTGTEVFEKNADAVFSIYYRVPEYWNLCEEVLAWRYPYFLFEPTGLYAPGGSGFFVSAAGVAVTNHHVAIGWEHMLIRTHEGGIYPILGYYSYDIDNDIAIIQVGGSGFQYTTFSEVPVRVGDNVFAIGSSDGDPNTFTAGIISRFAGEISFDVYTITDMIQHTAPIYPGNSGGPLFDHYGKVVGVNAAASSWRASAAYAVRIERVDLDSALLASLNPLPLGGDAVAIVGTWVREVIADGILTIDIINFNEDGTFSERFEFWDVETNTKVEDYRVHEGSYRIEDNLIIFATDEWSAVYEFVREGNQLTLSELERDGVFVFIKHR